MNEFKIVEEQVTGDLYVTTNTQFNNISANKLIIAENIKVRLYGNATDVILKKGAQLYLHGRIFGEVQNEGGEVFTYFG